MIWYVMHDNTTERHLLLKVNQAPVFFIMFYLSLDRMSITKTSLE